MPRETIPVNIKRKIAWKYSGGKCYLCRSSVGEFIDDKWTGAGEFAHIEGLLPGSARHNSSKSKDELNKIENLIIACSTCHTLIDNKKSAEYPVTRLTAIKKEHESNIQYYQDFMNTNYFLIFKDILTKLSVLRTNSPIVVTPITPIQKINVNDLNEIEDIIVDGLNDSVYFVEYLKTIIEYEFKVNIRATIIKVYQDAIKKTIANIGNIDKIEAFWNCVAFVSGNKMEYSKFAIAIVCYYFQECDIFDRVRI